MLLGNRSGRRAFTLIETLNAIALLVIVLGLMVSLSRHVRTASADGLTKDILRRLDAAMAVYLSRNGDLPVVPSLLSDAGPPPDESVLQQNAEGNNEAFVRALNAQGLLSGRLNDLSITYYDEAHVRDAWGSPIVFMPHMHPAIGMCAKGWFFFSAGPDREYLTQLDNLYSYDQPAAQH